MTAAVLLDTSFLISLVDGKRPNHFIAAQYYRMMLEQQSPMFFSAIVAAEFAINAVERDCVLHSEHDSLAKGRQLVSVRITRDEMALVEQRAQPCVCQSEARDEWLLGHRPE